MRSEQCCLSPALSFPSLEAGLTPDHFTGEETEAPRKLFYCYCHNKWGDALSRCSPEWAVSHLVLGASRLSELPDHRRQVASHLFPSYPWQWCPP